MRAAALHLIEEGGACALAETSLEHQRGYASAAQPFGQQGAVPSPIEAITWQRFALIAA